MKTLNEILNFRLLALLFAAVLVTTSCDNDDDAAPEEEEELEVITNVRLTFTPVGGGQTVIGDATDPDGEGIQELAEQAAPIILAADTEYELTYQIINALDPNDPEDIGEEILEEDDEHQFFYAFSEGLFASPMGNGNVDTASDPLNYNDEDDNGNPVGLSTSWTTGEAATGTFTARLQHQPGIKTATTGANDGDTDFNLMFDLIIQ